MLCFLVSKACARIQMATRPTQDSNSPQITRERRDFQKQRRRIRRNRMHQSQAITPDLQRVIGAWPRPRARAPKHDGNDLQEAISRPFAENDAATLSPGRRWAKRRKSLSHEGRGFRGEQSSFDRSVARRLRLDR